MGEVIRYAPTVLYGKDAEMIRFQSLTSVILKRQSIRAENLTFARATITKYHTLIGWNSSSYCLTV